MILANAAINSFLTPYYLTYHSLILTALILAYISYRKGVKKVGYLVLVLLATFIVEGAAAYVKYFGIKGQMWIYHVFNLFEYAFFCLYYINSCTEQRYKKLVLWSIPAFVIFGSCVSGFVYHFSSMPALNINVEGLVLFVIYTHLLFCIDVDLRMYIYNHPDFWIATGVLSFFGGVFVYFNLYRTLLHLDHNGTLMMFGRITDPLNLILYTCIIIGLICLIRARKYLVQLD